jgi:predicted ester cyclase
MAVSGHKTEEFFKYIKAGLKLEIMVEELHKIPDLEFTPKLIVAELPKVADLVNLQSQILKVA